MNWSTGIIVTTLVRLMFDKIRFLTVSYQHKESDLIHNTSSSFNSRQFCDFNDYLPKLVLLAHIVDDEFQLSVKNIFNINERNGIGYLISQDTQNIPNTTKTQETTSISIETLNDIMTEIDNESKIDIDRDQKNDTVVTTKIGAIRAPGNNNKNTANQIKYTAGPVKLYSRALSKSENEYNKEIYPTSACVIDFNRCTLTFNDIKTLLDALNLFLNKVKYYQSGNIIKIVRCKNTFKNYVNEGAQYADIKLNVIISGKTNNIIGEVQFLLQPMLNFKKNGHNLYSIQRQESFISSSLSVILPQLLDKDKQLFVAGNMGNVTKLCQFMVLNNLNSENIMKLDPESSESILINICALGHMKALKFLESIVPNDLFMNRLFTKNRYGNNVVDVSAKSSSIFKQFFLNKIIVNKYKNDSKLIVNLLDYIAVGGTHNSLKVLIPVLGGKEFIKHACIPSRHNSTMFESAVNNGNIELIKILLSDKSSVVTQQYTSNEYWLYRLLYHLFCGNHENMDSIDYVIDKLKLSKSQVNNINHLVLKTMFEYTHKETLRKEDLAKNAWDYSTNTILSKCGWGGNYKILEKCMSIVGEKVFITNVLKPGARNTTLLENAIRKGKIEMIKLVLSYSEIRQEIKEKNYWLFRILWWLFTRGSRDIIDTVIKELNITKNDIVDLTNYKYKEVGQKLAGNAWKYETKHIIVDIGSYGNDAAMEALTSIVGDTQFSKFVFVQNAQNTTILENAIRKNNGTIIKSIVSLNYVKQIYQSDSYWTYRLFWWYQWGKIDNKISLFKDMVTDLGLTKEKSVALLKDYQYKENDPHATNFVK